MELNEAIEVTALTEYLEEQSDPEDDRFVFSYQITIRNHADQDVTLLSRHWYVTNGHGDMQEVDGEGVVGEQPCIPAGGEFVYSSGSVMSTSVGSMHGFYRMQSADKQHFQAAIPVFTLAAPFALN
ncbi:MAG: Co2+/Mg2+ efflux protein ApaG [Oceanobacter sp.]